MFFFPSPPDLCHENDFLLAPPPSKERAADSLFALKRLRLVDHRAVAPIRGGKTQSSNQRHKRTNRTCTSSNFKQNLSNLSLQFLPSVPSTLILPMTTRFCTEALKTETCCWGEVTFAKSFFLQLLFLLIIF